MTKYLKMVSSDRLPNIRRSDVSSQAQQQRSLEKIQRYLEDPVDEDGLVKQDSRTHRRRLMVSWEKYFHARDRDPDAIWSGLCEDDKLSIAWAKAFFSDYVEHSMRDVMVLGPEEYVTKRAVNSATTALAMWRKLVKEADLTVLQAKRRQEPQAASKWRLRFNGHASSGRKPASSLATWEISQWIWTTLAEDFKLTKELTFNKVEATPEDVVVVLRTLWDRAADLGIDPKTRIAFHANVLMSAMGGFRPGCLGKLRYQDVVITILRSPQDPSKVKYAATISIFRNKLKDSLSVRVSDKIKFSVCFLPCPLVCLARLVVSRAIHDDAFDATFVDAEEFLTRPALGTVDSIDLKWKDDVLDSNIFELSYTRFHTIWRRVCQSAGLRTQPRLYAMRVGAGARLDAHPLFSDAVRNYVMSHSDSMFKMQYQTSRIREDLAKAAFGPKAGSENGPLFALLRNLSLSKDRNAPMEVPQHEMAEFDAREDATSLREAMIQARAKGNSDFYDTLNSRLKYRRGAWKSLKLDDNRRKYFELADKSRALGQQPPHGETKLSNLASGSRIGTSNAPMATQVSRYLERTLNLTDNDGNSARYIDLLVAYLRKRSRVELDVCEEKDDCEMKEEEEGNDGSDDDDDDDDNDESFKCLICNVATSGRKTLTNHYRKHIKLGMFEGSFKCPNCQDNRVEALIKTGFAGWVKHLEHVHGERYTPYYEQTQMNAPIYPCPLQNCKNKDKKPCFTSTGLSIHFTRIHASEVYLTKRDSLKLKEAIQCPRCILQGVKTTKQPPIRDLAEWRHHFESVHCSENRTVFECYICLRVFDTALSRKLHFLRCHEKVEGFFTNPFPCPECVRVGDTDTHEITGREAWQQHIMNYHNGATKEMHTNTLYRAPETVPHFPCLVCLRCHTSTSLLRQHLAKVHAELFEKPFLCPACVRNGDGNGKGFAKKSAWLVHVAREHMGYRTGPSICPCHADPNARPSSPLSEGVYSDSDPCPTLGSPAPLQQCGSSGTSATNSIEESEYDNLLGENFTACSSPLSELDDTAMLEFENARSLARVQNGRKRKRNSMEGLDGIQVWMGEEIPIDPFLLQLP